MTLSPFWQNSTRPTPYEWRRSISEFGYRPRPPEQPVPDQGAQFTPGCEVHPADVQPGEVPSGRGARFVTKWLRKDGQVGLFHGEFNDA